MSRMCVVVMVLRGESNAASSVATVYLRPAAVLAFLVRFLLFGGAVTFSVN